MIKVEKLSYGVPAKDLYKEVSFTLEDGQHCGFIGSNGTGKSTLIDMMIEPEEYLFKGKIIKDEQCRIGYVNQFSAEEKNQEMTVFQYLASRFEENQEQQAAVCARMAEEEDLEPLFEQYQKLLDQFQAMDGEHYESNIRRQLKMVGLQNQEDTLLSNLSGGEYKLVQIIREMILQPNLLIMDEPDVFLDFENLKGLSDLINSHKGTLLVVTHNRYLLNNCFDKILHLEDGDIQEFDGSYTEYNNSILQRKVELQEQAAAEQEEIERTEKMVGHMRAEATRISMASLGRALHAKETHLARLKARQIKAPFVEIRQPKIILPAVGTDQEGRTAAAEAASMNQDVLLRVQDYQITFDQCLLDNVTFDLHANEKIAIVGANGTGKTTLLREIWKKQNPAIQIGDGVEIGFLSQLHGEMLNESNTVYEEFLNLGFDNERQIAAYLSDYCFDPETLEQRISQLSGGEKNLLQIAKISLGHADLLLLDEPTSHLDLYSQLALEKAVSEYKGAVLMVSHDFYNIVNCADSVLWVEDKTVRRVRVRTFRQKMYEAYFDKGYLEKEQKRKELETRIAVCLKNHDFQTAKKLCEQLDEGV